MGKPLKIILGTMWHMRVFGKYTHYLSDLKYAVFFNKVENKY